MSFSWEIDDESWIALTAEYEHLADPDLFTFARGFIRSVVGGVGQFELQSYSFAHDANRVNRINEGFCRRFEKVPVAAINHLVVPTLSNRNRRFVAVQHFLHFLRDGSIAHAYFRN